MQILEIVQNYCEENEIYPEAEINSKTNLISEVGLNSIDIVAIVKDAERIYQSNKNLIDLLMPTEGSYRDDINPETIHNFFNNKQSSNIANNRMEICKMLLSSIERCRSA